MIIIPLAKFYSILASFLVTPAQRTQLWLNIQSGRINIQVAKSCVNSSNTGIQHYTISQEESV